MARVISRSRGRFLRALLGPPTWYFYCFGVIQDAHAPSGGAPVVFIFLIWLRLPEKTLHDRQPDVVAHTQYIARTRGIHGRGMDQAVSSSDR
jgi:hypothetical protein